MPPISMPLWKKILYSGGQFGWSLCSFGIASLLPYFYMPPETATDPIFPTYIFQGAIMGIATIIGLISSSGRLFDAITDPIIAGWSDRSKSRLGKRRVFLLISGLPMALTSFLVFYPPVGHQSEVNAIWLTVIIMLFFIFHTMYVIPFTALISELGHNPKERLVLSTITSVAWALGFFIGNSVYMLQSAFEEIGLNSTEAFQSTILIFASVSAIMMYLPVLVVDEKKYGQSVVSKEKTYEALWTALKNKNFRVFIISDFGYWLSNTFLEIGIIYYVTILLEIDKSRAFELMAVMFITSFIFYYPILKVTPKLGRKNLIYIAFFGYLFLFAAISTFGWVEAIEPMTQAYIVMIIAAIPVAIFGMIPNAMLADLTQAHGIETGQYKAGIFFGARAFVMKLGISATNLIFPSFLLLGKSVENDDGVRLSAVAAFVFCLIGLLIFTRYNEKHILSVLSEQEDLSEEEAVIEE